MKTERFCQLVAALMGAQCAFSSRNGGAGVDGIAYFDVAKAYLNHDWHTALNGYWSPLYSWLLALAMSIFPVNAETQLQLARVINLILFLAAIYGFSLAWNALAKRSQELYEPLTSIAELYPAGWTIFGYTLFVSTAIWYVGAVVPDLAVAAVVFAIIALLLRLEDGKRHALSAYIVFGMLLALGYFTKTILFYFAAFLLIALTLRHLKRKSYARPAAAAVAFLVVIAPFVFFLSRTLGHITVGDAGRLAYAWLADVPETKNWLTDQPTAAALPFYPGPLLHADPMVFRLPLLPGVAYAPRYDASRYDLRNHPHFDGRTQLKRIVSNLRAVNQMILGAEEPLLLSLLILALYSPHNFLRRLLGSWFYTLPILAIVSMYILILVTWRYFLAFSPLLWGAALAAISIPARMRETVRPVMLAGIIVFALHTVPGLLHFLVTKDNSAQPEIALAESLPSYGIKRGDLVASLGDGKDALWAELAGVSVVAEIWSADTPHFWASSPSDQDEMVHAMIAAGAKALVWRTDSTQPCRSPWRTLPASSGCILLADHAILTR